MAWTNTLLRSLTAAAAFATLAAGRKCVTFTMPVPVNARNAVFDIDTPETNIDVTNFFLDLSRVNNNLTAKVLTGYTNVSGIYDIEGTYCEPENKPTGVQVLVHGIGFDRSYWDFPANNYSNSYVDAALAQGWATFAYDRPGIGQSAHGDPVNEIQSFLEVEVLVAITKLLRDGLYGPTPAYKKVVHVGHSFGSIQVYALADQHKELTDGICLTGFSQNGSYNTEFQLGGNFVQANTIPHLSDYADGYFASGSESGVQSNFFAPGDFEPEFLEAAYNASQPVTVGELLTLAAPVSVINHYDGPVKIVTGDLDIPFCGGNCSVSSPSIPQSAVQFFPEAAYFKTYIVPGAGHGLNLEKSAPDTFDAILNFFAIV
ncbi:hypothetical protein E8E14_012683 [Neopestalotiopsis sp. 37M]|nr:hypothetical protein E8E14_012683 [Neopestalotiopsis sp. 37M]